MVKPKTLQANISKRNPWWISKHSYYTAYHYAMRYREWKDEYKNLANNLSSPGFGGTPTGSGAISRPTETTAIKMSELKNKMKMIEDTVKETDKDLFKWLFKAVTNEDVTYTYLQNIMRIPCSRNTLYDRRRKFYYLLSKKI